MEKVSVLVTSVGSTTSIGVIKLVKASNIPVHIVGTDINEEKHIAGSSFCDRFCQVPAFYENNYIEVIAGIVKREKITLIIPIHDQEIEILSRQSGFFESLGCRIIVSNIETILRVNDKYLFAKTLQDAGVLTPLTYTAADWIAQTPCGTERWVLKPVQGVSSRGITIGETSEIRDRISRSESMADYIVQEFIEGTEYTVDVFVKEKDPYCIVPRVRLEVREGLCYKAATVKNEEFIQPVRQVLRLFDFYGPINIQFIKSKNSEKVYCIECNPRFGGSSIITLYAGINLFSLIMADIQTSTIVLQPAYREVYMTRYWEEIFHEI